MTTRRSIVHVSLLYKWVLMGLVEFCWQYGMVAEFLVLEVDLIGLLQIEAFTLMKVFHLKTFFALASLSFSAVIVIKQLGFL